MSAIVTSICAVLSVMVVASRSVFRTTVAIAGILVVVVMIVIVVPLSTTRVLPLDARDDLLQLATVQPYPPTLRAVVDFNTLALRDSHFNFADWALHYIAPEG